MSKKLRIIFIASILLVVLVFVGEYRVEAISKKMPVPVLTSETITKPKLVWNSVGSGYQYRLYRSEARNGYYKCIQKDMKVTSYLDNSAVTGKKYYYVVRATKLVNNRLVYGDESKPFCVNWVKDDIVLTSSINRNQVTLKWTQLNSKNNSKYLYDVYRASKPNGTYTCIKAGLTTSSYTVKKNTSVGLRYYKIKPYRVQNGRNIYGTMSNAVSDQMVVDLVLFVGQSNMAGRGENYKLAPTLEEGVAYEFRAITDPTKLYHMAEPFGLNENKQGGINDVSRTYGTPVKSGGMVSSLCQAYYQQTGVPIVGVSASISSTSIKLFQPGQGILNDAINRLNTAKRWLETNEYNIRHIYMVFCQGESDHKMISTEYIGYAQVMIAELQKHGVEMCFVVPIGDHKKYPGIYTNLRYAQKELCDVNPYAYFTADLASSLIAKGMMNGTTHYSQAGYNLVGRGVGIVMGKYVKSLEK